MKHVPFDTGFWKQLLSHAIVGTWMVVLFCYNADSADITELKSAVIGGAGIVMAQFAMAYLKPKLDALRATSQGQHRTSGTQN